MRSKRKQQENSNICKFIACVSSKNYNKANKYLQSVVESKLEMRIKKALKQPLF